MSSARIAFLAPALVAAGLALLSSSAPGGSNCWASLVLHAKSGWDGGCTFTGEPDCLSPPGGIRPTVNVPPNGEHRIYLYVNHSLGLTGLQTAFIWDPGWDLVQSFWDCRPNQITARVPDPDSNGGPTDGTLITSFDCMTSPLMTPIGRMDFRAGPEGCLSQIHSSYPFGSHLIDCVQRRDLAQALGKICVGIGGYDACEGVYYPPPSCWCSARGPYVGQVGVPVEFTGLYNNCRGPTFTWDFGDGSTGSGLSTTHVYQAPAVYTVAFTVIEGGRCDTRTTSLTTATIEGITAVEGTPPGQGGVAGATWGRVKAARR